MELKVSSSKPAFSLSDCNSDPEEKEISEEDDDDRNHKHRRRELHSQSAETEAVEPVFSRPFRKRNKPFENGHLYGEEDSQLSETKFPRRRGMGSISRASLDSYQRMRLNQSQSGDAGNGRGQGRDLSAWGQRASRFSSVDIASQLFPQGPVTPAIFTGRGVQNVANAQSSSWSAFGMVPGISNGGVDTFHSVGFPGTLRSSLNPTVNMGILPRQRCRDFEERGFCLRGDMCPMEHGVNRIVVEDVQSLSQFNLPASLPNAHMLGAATGQGSLPVIGPSGSLTCGKPLHCKSSKFPVIDDALGFTDGFVDGSIPGGADFYDPDQPLWSNDRPETSDALQDLTPSNIDDICPLLAADSSDYDQVGLCDPFDLEHPLRGAKAASGSQSVWGRIRRSKNKLNVKERTACTGNASRFDEMGKDLELFDSSRGISLPGDLFNEDTIDLQMKDLSSRPQGSSGHNIRKPSQKALRTLFVRGIPQKDNKPDVLLSHFKKFGEVIDIHIPLSGDRAFVQFSKREEAEAALKAPDAVMGNRFIKLLWANRDRIMDDGVNVGSNLPLTPRGVTSSLVPPHLSVPSNGKANIQSTAPKAAGHGPVAPLPTSGLPKPVAHNGPKAAPAVQKKVENLELLKEELRKKQELLDQKRNEFRRQLSKLEKQSVVVKAEANSDQELEKQKEGETVSNSTKERSSSMDLNDVSSAQTEAVSVCSRSTDNAEHSCSIPCSAVATQEPSSLRLSIRPLAPHGAPFVFNRYKLDNRPTAFKVLPPMPSGLANVAVLKEHFSTFGNLPSVELDDSELQDGNNGTKTLNISACICFPTRRSAERAFSNGNIWQGQALQFMWLQSSNSTKDIGVKKDADCALKQPPDVSFQTAPKNTQEETAVVINDPEKCDIECKKQPSNADVQPSPNDPFWFTGRKCCRD
ncbi:putative trithorax group protein osa-like [Capsicum annuum]|uniref:zinc finger CCCH domain-containing protein 41 n=1 Tax=Capsicum annuum TaxID=4072 RepID=UPI0007BF6CAF|nr:zinc finger CCCH domain-containing protein 41 [Capsicum annuum]XP_016569919.1 zinc finger CCCH domain-containing protein 41 [Capsicum annuum]XP_016569921.1 zinc finger CCCH domain-containing protein 41 [Capsicum annuum]XP_016569922.1 zinc finger CCCH domain-containing protein 41 [Capsicum annuum]XP_016569925.1 zinc finger CCCH domain-containing protein 41 [Capsicum annuum]XP_047267953.1 zinc finger CCCH domain-containing protein 41 [Capsicum annuum]XP_047267954.1 zinc finger CCCH domain-co